METWKRGCGRRTGTGTGEAREARRRCRAGNACLRARISSCPASRGGFCRESRKKRPPPVRELELLVGGDSAESLEQIGEAEGEVTQIGKECHHARGAARVEEIDLGGSGERSTHDVDAEVLLEPLDVHVGAVEDFEDRRVGEDFVQLADELADRQHVHQVVRRARRDLYESAAESLPGSSR